MGGDQALWSLCTERGLHDAADRSAHASQVKSDGHGPQKIEDKAAAIDTAPVENRILRVVLFVTMQLAMYVSV